MVPGFFSLFGRLFAIRTCSAFADKKNLLLGLDLHVYTPSHRSPHVEALTSKLFHLHERVRYFVEGSGVHGRSEGAHIGILGDCLNIGA